MERHRWRSSPPTPDEVSTQMWWWNKPADGVPHILQLDRDLGSGLIFDAGDSSSCPPPFDPSDWPGEWAPCLVMSHADKVRGLRAQLAERSMFTADEERTAGSLFRMARNWAEEHDIPLSDDELNVLSLANRQPPKPH